MAWSKYQCSCVSSPHHVIQVQYIDAASSTAPNEHELFSPRSSLTPSELFKAVSMDSDAQNHTQLISAAPNITPDLPNMSSISITPSTPSTALTIESIAQNVTQTHFIAPNTASKITHVSSFQEFVIVESDA